MAQRKLEDFLGAEQLAAWRSLTSPARIQAFLDETPYSTDDANRSPLSVLRDRVAHCYDGALLAAAALRRLGYPPLVVDLLPEPGRDDDHLLAVFRQGGGWGAVAKSNFAGLRYREPVFRSLRELAMSYFELFFNVDGAKTLRAYTRPLNLARLDRYEWEWRDEGADAMERRLHKLRPISLLSPSQAQSLSIVDPLSYRAGTLATDPAGLYKPARPVP